MSDPHTQAGRASEPHGHGVRQEEDRIPSMPIVAVGVGALVLFFLASFVTISYLRVQGRGTGRHSPSRRSSGSRRSASSSSSSSSPRRAAAATSRSRRERLGSYGWVDRQAGVVHLPIDRAMELSARGVRPRVQAPGGRTTEAQP